MKLLLLGGTRFLGRAIVEAALSANHEVTLFNRGQSNPDLFPDIETLVGDRDGGLDVLNGRYWDAVIDTCGYVPRIVGASAQKLADQVDHYTFISSISAYADFSQVGMDENAPLATIEDETVEEINGETYGALKVLCETAVATTMGANRALHVRSGLIVGPHDPTDRFTYWPYRLAQGGEVLAPGNPQSPVQIIDVADIAEWTIHATTQRLHGPYNIVGPAQRLTMADLLTTCQHVSDQPSQLTWVSADFLHAHEVQPFVEMPLWVGEGAEEAGFETINNAQAIAAGLTFRSLIDTVRDTLDWAQSRPADYQWRGGLKPEREAELLALWHTQQAA